MWNSVCRDFIKDIHNLFQTLEGVLYITNNNPLEYFGIMLERDQIVGILTNSIEQRPS
jgi:hypothetical protein